MTLRTHLESIAAGTAERPRGNVLPASVMEIDRPLHDTLAHMAQRRSVPESRFWSAPPDPTSAPSALLPPLP